MQARLKELGEDNLCSGIGQTGLPIRLFCISNQPIPRFVNAILNLETPKLTIVYMDNEIDISLDHQIMI